MVNPTPPTRLVEWTLGTFHTSLFFALFTTLLYLAGSLGNLLASLNTLIGIAVFLFLWLTTWWSTRQVVRRIFGTADLSDTSFRIRPRQALLLALYWGGLNGLLFFLPLFLLFVLVLLAVNASPDFVRMLTTGDWSTIAAILGFWLFAGALGSIIAFVVGALAGVAFALLDLVLLASSQMLFRAAAGDRAA